MFGETDRIMAFDVVLATNGAVPDVSPTGHQLRSRRCPTPTRTRKVALFEGKDEFGRLQPLLGTAEPATDFAGNADQLARTQPSTPASASIGQMEGSIAWHSPTTRTRPSATPRSGRSGT